MPYWRHTLFWIHAVLDVRCFGYTPFWIHTVLETHAVRLYMRRGPELRAFRHVDVPASFSPFSIDIKPKYHYLCPNNVF